MTLTEPLTMLSDYALAAISLWFAISTARLIGPGNRVSAWFWCAAFVASGVAAALGGTRHGFAGNLDDGGMGALRTLTIFSMGACGAFVTAGIHAVCIKRHDEMLKWIVSGVAVTLLGAAVQQSPLHALGFNHNDLYHVVQAMGLYCLFRAARLARDRPAVPGEIPMGAANIE